MFLVDGILLIGGVLTLIAVWSSKLSARFGVPVLVLCLAIGMLAGSDGVGKISFENYTLAHGVGTVALAIILFDGGLRTSFRTVRLGWKPASVLATVGVGLTALITGLAASKILQIPLLHGLLLGSIVSSTDAAAVFLILKKQGLNLKERLSATLELESGSNDPMAVFLTIGAIQVIQGSVGSNLELLMLFVKQMLVGALVGVGIGLAGARLINRIDLDTPGLYPILAGSIGFISFGLAATFEGSGFLAVYLAGILMGSGEVVFRRGIYMFHDGAAWMAQIVMFVVLGLLVFPRSLLDVAWQGVVVALVLTLVARPLSIALCVCWNGFSIRELMLLSWAGLKGAVPVILAIYPLLFQVEHGRLIFDVVFFVVLISALTQGWSLPAVARRLGLDEGSVPEPYASLEINSLKHVDAEIVEFLITEHSPVAGHSIAEIPLPQGVLIALVAREQRALPPDGATVLELGDHIFVVHHRDQRALMDRIFGGSSHQDALVPCYKAYIMRADVRVADLKKFYRIVLEADESLSLADLLSAQAEGAQRIELNEWTVESSAFEEGSLSKVALMKVTP